MPRPPTALWTLVFIGAWIAAALFAVGAVWLFGATTGEAAPPLECGRRLSSVSEDRIVPRSARVVLALDEEWHDEFGDRAESVARSIVSDVSGLYRDVGLHLLPVRVADWASPEELTSAEDLLVHVSDAVALDGADLVIGLTGQSLPRVDGFARVGGQVAVVGHHRGAPERDVLVLAHEIGHLFGAHHGCDIPGIAGVMAGSGFEDPLIVCPCTRSILEANVARFHQD